MRACLVFLLAAASAAAAPKTLPSSWPKCKRKDPRLNECVRDGIQAAITDLSVKGAKEFGVFSIDPMVISRLKIEQGQGPVSITLEFTDLNIVGFKNMKIGLTKANVDNYHIHADILMEEGMNLKGHYKIDGKVLVLPIRGEGEAELTLKNTTAIVDLFGKEMKKDRQVYMNVTDFKYTFETTHLSMRMENLFGGNKELSDQMNRFLNQNWSEILAELKPSFQDALGAAYRDICKRIFSRVPYNDIFLN